MGPTAVFLYFLTAAFSKALNQMQTLLCNTEDLMIWMDALLLAFKLSLCMTCCFIITFCIKSYCPTVIRLPEEHDC